MAKENNETPTATLEAGPPQAEAVEAKPAAPMAEIDKVELERQIRKYVKKDGGWRKNLSRADINKGKRLVAQRPKPIKPPAGVNGPVWDFDIVVPNQPIEKAPW
jgi:hypothetical protein